MVLQYSKLDYIFTFFIVYHVFYTFIHIPITNYHPFFQLGKQPSAFFVKQV
jgi:hypothetical protein